MITVAVAAGRTAGEERARRCARARPRPRGRQVLNRRSTAGQRASSMGSGVVPTRPRVRKTKRPGRIPAARKAPSRNSVRRHAVQRASLPADPAARPLFMPGDGVRQRVTGPCAGGWGRADVSFSPLPVRQTDGSPSPGVPGVFLGDEFRRVGESGEFKLLSPA